MTDKETVGTIHTEFAFDLVGDEVGLVVAEMHDGRRRRHSEPFSLRALAVPLLALQLPLATLPLVLVVSSLSVVDVQPARVWQIRAVTDAHPVTCTQNTFT